MSIKVCSFCNSQGEKDITYWQSEDGSACMCSECSLEHAKATLDILNGIAENTNDGSNKCSFCYTEETDRIYRYSKDGLACMCGNCCVQFARVILEKREEEGGDQSGEESLDKNERFQDYLVALEEKWMEKNVINSYVLDAGGRINLVTFRFEDDGDDFYFVCELEVEGIEELPEDVEENILNEIEWAFDEIRGDLESEGLDLDGYLGEKILLKTDNSEASSAKQSSSELDELCEAIGDKLMETGYLTSALEDGDLAIVSINVESDESLFKININLVVDDRQSGELSPDEEENICDTFDSFLEERGLKGSFAELGFDLDDNFDGYYAHLVE